MTNEKIIKARQVQKHDTEENWLKAGNFVPKAGEIIVYDKDKNNDKPRFKIGDGESLIGNLPFFSSSSGAGGGSIAVTDDGNGNVTINSQALTVTDDGNGNVSLN